MAAHKAGRFLPHIIVLLAIIATGAYLARPRILRGNPEGPIPLEFPEKLGAYTADDLWFCHNDQCLRTLRQSTLPEPGENGERLCPFCTNSLHTISLGEIRMLPPNTPVFRKLYSAKSRPDIHVTFVFTGAERVSIHRPQICLVSQGSRLTNEYEYDAKTAAERRMPVRVIETLHDIPSSDGTKLSQPSVFIYWYFNPERETTSHFERLFWVACDNALRNYRPRWAYVSIVISMNPEPPHEFQNVLDDFLPDLYPLIEDLRAAFRQSDGINTVQPTSSGDN